jgi:alpha-beta hydrolase superfamily lysophospholipase
LSLPEDLDAYLAESEARHPDLRPGCAKRIVWHEGVQGRRTRVALVYVHGFSASPGETAPFADDLAKALGANLFYTRLTGHGRSPEAMAECSVPAWLADGEEALDVAARLGERTVLIGCSTGATLAVLLAAGPRGAQVRAQVLLSPNFGPRAFGSFLLDWYSAPFWVRQVLGDERVVPRENELHERFWTLRYPSAALLPMAELVRRARRSDLPSLRTPTLVIFNPQDKVVSPGRIRSVLRRLGASTLQVEQVQGTEDPSAHVLCGDAFGPAMTGGLVALARDFLEVEALA